MRFTAESCFQLDQRRDLKVRLELAGRYRLICGFHRKKSRIENSSKVRYPGDDYITYRYHDEKILFVVCDGVSGGFGGYLASSFLGNRMLEWLQSQNFTTTDATGLLDPLIQELYAWVPDATRLVNAATFLIPPTDEADKKFKERRRARGAQTTFVAGVLDYRNDIANFFWMGDTRLLLDFGDGRREIQNKSNEWDQHRWATLDGLKGSPDGCKYRCSDLRRVVVYTDGLPDVVAEKEIKGWEDEDFLRLRVVQPPDDVSVMVISIVPSEWKEQPALDPPRPISSEKSEIEFDEIPEGSWTRVRGRINNSIYAIDLEPHITVFKPADYDLTGRGRYEFQLISGEKLPSQHTKPIPLYGKPASPVVPIPAPPKPAPPKPLPIPPGPHPAPQPRPSPSGLRIRSLLSLAGWVLAVLGWGVAAYLFFRLYQAQDYAKEQQKRVDDLMATVTRLEILPPPSPTVQTPPPVEGVTPTQATIPPTVPMPAIPSIESPSEVLTPVSHSPSPIQTTISPTVTPTSASDAVGECRKFTTVAEGLVLHLEPNESSQLVLNVPVNHTLTYLGAEGQWYLLRDGDEGYASSIEGWASLQGLEEFTGCVDE